MKRVFPIVFLEGEPVPVQSVQIVSTVDGLSQISIILFPSENKILPNTIVHVAFYTDDDPTPYLLGEGVVIGRRATRSKNANNADELLVVDLMSMLVNVPVLFTPLESRFFQSVWTLALNNIGEVTNLSDMNIFLNNLLSKTGSIDNAVKRIIRGAIGNAKNSSYNAMNQPFDLASRIYSVITGAGVKSLLNAESFASFIQQNFGQADMDLTLLSLLMSFLQVVGYHLVSLPSPSLISSSNVHQYVCSPQVLYGPIPGSNWIYSSFISEYSYSIDYSNMPTRIIAPLTFMNNIEIDPTTSGGTAQTTSSSQSSVPNDSKTVTKSGPTRLHASIGPAELRMKLASLGNYLGKLTDPACRTNEEKQRGIRVVVHPLDYYLGFVNVTAKGTLSKFNKSNAEIIQSYTDMFYHMARLGAVNVSLSPMIFNPYIIPGLPGGIFTPKEGFVGGGPINRVMHVLKSTGEASTIVDFSGFAEADEYMLSDNYYYFLSIHSGVMNIDTCPDGSSAKIATSEGEGSLLDVNVYQNAFGVNAYSPSNPSMLANAASSLDDQLTILKSERSLVSLSQFISFEGIPVPHNVLAGFYNDSVTTTIYDSNGSSAFTGKIFNPDRHKAVMDYKKTVENISLKGIF